MDWRVEQDKDKVLHRVVELVKGQTKLTERQRQKELPPVRKLLAYWDNLVLHDGVLYKESVVKGSLVRRLVVPRHWQQEVLRLSHDEIGHLGHEKTMSIAYGRYFWIGCHGMSKISCRAVLAAFAQNLHICCNGLHCVV